jgi:hypothetical protein
LSRNANRVTGAVAGIAAAAMCPAESFGAGNSAAAVAARRQRVNGFHLRVNDIAPLPDACNSGSIAKHRRLTKSARCVA